MPWHAEFLPDSRIIESQFQGDISPNELDAATQQIIQLAMKHDVSGVLADCTQLADGHTIIDLNDMANAVERSGMIHKIKNAIVRPHTAEASKLVNFWETTCVNRGMQVRVYDDRKHALAWLTNA